jgi:hypothetical protein
MCQRKGARRRGDAWRRNPSRLSDPGSNPGVFHSVRLYISRAVYAADLVTTGTQTLRLISKQASEVVAELSIMSQPRGSGENPPSPVPAPLEVKEVLSKPLGTLTNPEDQITWGKASLAARNFADAERALHLALSQVGDRPDVALAYAKSLYGSKSPDNARIIAVLEGARRRLDSATPISLRRQIIEELLNAYLYSDPPNGFQAALRLLDEYIWPATVRTNLTRTYTALQHTAKSISG